MKNRKILIILCFSIFCKILFASLFPVFADEAYYYIWSVRLQLSYFDHPPAVSWLIYLGHLFLPAGNSLSLRILFIFASTLTSVIWVFILQKKKFNDYSIQVFLILALLNPLLGPGSVIATPDVPLILFWSLSYYAFLGLFDDTDIKTKYLNYSLLGAALGLGFCSKYHIVLFVISGLFALFIDKSYKKIRLPGVLLTVLFGLIFSLPVLIWNYQNDWSSFLYQLQHGFGKPHYDWHWTLNFYLSQIALMSPLVFYSLFQKMKDKNDQTFSWTQLFFFTTSSFKAIVEANWPITSHQHSNAHFLQSASPRKIKATFIYWGFIYFLVIVFFNTPMAKKTLQNQYRSTQLDELIPLVEKFHPLYGPSYQIASLLSWKTQKFIPKLNGLSRFDFYDTLPESNPSESNIFVLKHFDSIWPEKYQKYTKTKLESFENLQIELYQLAYE